MFALVMSFTPGPNNILLASSGATYGVWPTLPHILGVTLGFPVMLLCVACGIAAVLRTVPLLQVTMKVFSILYLLWLAWKIANAGPPRLAHAGRPWSFIQAAAYQWLNPKAWTIAIGSVTAYTTGKGIVLLMQAAILGLVSMIVSMVSSISWALGGKIIGQFTSSPGRRRAFNFTMATLLVLSIVPIWFE